jgi:hypothetical protein
MGLFKPRPPDVIDHAGWGTLRKTGPGWRAALPADGDRPPVTVMFRDVDAVFIDWAADVRPRLRELEATAHAYLEAHQRRWAEGARTRGVSDNDIERATAQPGALRTVVFQRALRDWIRMSLARANPSATVAEGEPIICFEFDGSGDVLEVIVVGDQPVMCDSH